MLDKIVKMKESLKLYYRTTPFLPSDNQMYYLKPFGFVIMHPDLLPTMQDLVGGTGLTLIPMTQEMCEAPNNGNTAWDRIFSQVEAQCLAPKN
jgi:hypothetical protein